MRGHPDLLTIIPSPSYHQGLGSIHQQYIRPEVTYWFKTHLYSKSHGLHRYIWSEAPNSVFDSLLHTNPKSVRLHRYFWSDVPRSCFDSLLDTSSKSVKMCRLECHSPCGFFPFHRTPNYMTWHSISFHHLHRESQLLQKSHGKARILFPSNRSFWFSFHRFRKKEYTNEQ